MSSISSPKISQEFAQKLFEEGAALILLNVPPGTEIGIDLHSWNVGPRFKGIKLIPPGLHFIYYSAVSKQGETAPRTGFFHQFQQKEILVRSYQNESEDFVEESAEQTQRIRDNIHNLDRDMGCYHLETWRRWFSLTQHLTEQYINTVVPLTGVVNSVPTMVPVDNQSSTVNSDARKKLKTSHTTSDSMSSSTENEVNKSSDEISSIPSITKPSDASSHSKEELANSTIFITDDDASDVMEVCKSIHDTTGQETKSDYANESSTSDVTAHSSQPACSTADSCIKDDGLPELVAAPGTEWRWKELPKRPYKTGASPAEVTASSMDSSFLLTCLIDNMNSSLDVISELQLSFVAFFVGQSWGGWERWKKLIDVLCRAEQALTQQPDLFAKFMAAMHFQIQEVPEDLFVDIVEHENFLAASLASLFANVTDNQHNLPTALVDRARKFKQHLTAHFAWQLDIDGNEEDAPVVVEL